MSEKFHWEHPPHDHKRYQDYDGLVIVCEYDDCDWKGTAWASQFVIHATRHHDHEL